MAVGHPVVEPGNKCIREVASFYYQTTLENLQLQIECFRNFSNPNNFSLYTSVQKIIYRLYVQSVVRNMKNVLLKMI